MPELIWDGKYRDHEGRRVRVEPSHEVLPLRIVEHAGPSRGPRSGRAAGGGEGWSNRLIRGDKRRVLPALLPEFRGRVDLIYIDPPFDTGADFALKTRVPPGPGVAGRSSTVLEQRAYRDSWERGLDGYLQWLYETAVLLRELLAERGSLYVHLDWRAVHYAKAVLDEVFGGECFRAEIIWRYRRWPVPTPNVQRMHDSILSYVKGTQGPPIFHTLYEELAPSTRKTFGTRKQVADFSSGRRKPGQRDEDTPGTPLSDVWDIGVIAPSGHERVGYPTQKPEALLERIVRLSSDEGSLVLDCFGGSGTTAVVAEKLGRRWIVADVGRLAVHTTRQRLLALESLRPLVVQDLGPHEPRAWLASAFASPSATPARELAGARRGKVAGPRAREAAGRAWLLALFGAQPVGRAGSRLHGRKGEAWVSVGSVRAPVSLADVKALVAEAQLVDATAVEVLGWSFADDALESGRRVASQAGVAVTFRRIPREVLDERAMTPGAIAGADFAELSELTARLRVRGRSVQLELTGFAFDSGGLPPEVQQAVGHWSQWLAAWAVDWDWQGDAVRPQWQAARSRRDAGFSLEAAHQYGRPGVYRIAVLVIDLAGHETRRVLSRRVG